MKGSPEIVLAIESAIAGGSISLLADGSEVGNWIGSAEISKAEDLLANIDLLLKEHDVAKEDLDLIAVSAGPGSFTGIRIGLATALGLKNGLGIAMSSESALIAIMDEKSVRGKVVAAIPAGRKAVCVQNFINSVPTGMPRSMTDADFKELVRCGEDVSFILHEALYLSTGPPPLALSAGTNIARAVGLICRKNVGFIRDPLFISKEL